MTDDLEISDLKHLQLTQDEMAKKMSMIDDEPVQENLPEGSQQMSLLKPLKISRKIGWRKGWNWKQSPAKSSSIEEEPNCILESPKKSHQSSQNSSPSLSPKQNVNNTLSPETVSEGAETSILIRKKYGKCDKIPKCELRSSASARLLQFLESKDSLDKMSSDEFLPLVTEKNGGRPASIHVTQSTQNDDAL